MVPLKLFGYNAAVRALTFIVIALVATFVLGFYAGSYSKKSEPASIETSPVYETATTTVDASTHEWYPLVKVIDGDTLVVAKDRENPSTSLRTGVTIRLIGLDTPETVDPREPVQCFGQEASEKAKQILSGTSVRIETDPSQGELDKYGRLLAYVFLTNGTNFNEYMIAEGYGHEYTYNLPYRYQAAFKAAEERARAEKRGLWADNACDNNDLRSRYSEPQPLNANISSPYECSRNAYNCGDFTTQAEAQAAFESCLPAEASAQAGGGSANDVHKLDADGDGKVCESLP
ncbi:thermonuclease family protein [Candidatus Kaiserbacteria bacterium]|nr:thermonuclease family protein [Candidatus Kaiserbacteria bacterium]